MSRYDGLIIPRSYSEYINKTDAATLSQALQLGGVLDSAPTEDSVKAVKSGGVFDALAGKQPILTFDNVPTEDSDNPVKSGGIYDALDDINALITEIKNKLVPIGSVVACAVVDPNNTAWLECNGQSVARADYPTLFNLFNTQTQTVEGVEKTLLEIYGSADSTHFNLPDYREAALVGAGQNASDTIADHDVYTVGQFKDDQLQEHCHMGMYNKYPNGIYYMQEGSHGTANTSNVLNAREGDVTRGKRKGVKYIIKVL